MHNTLDKKCLVYCGDDFCTCQIKLDTLRISIPKQIAQEICSVQPIDVDFKSIIENCSESEEMLLKNGYKPVSSLKLMYIKDK